MSGPVEARGPCPHGVVDDICWQCTPASEVLRQAGAILSRGVKMSGKAYEAIGVELERLAVELHNYETASATRAELEDVQYPDWPPTNRSAHPREPLTPAEHQHAITEGEALELHRRGLNTESSRESILEALEDIRGGAGDV
jgi:hypothetical protein